MQKAPVKRCHRVILSLLFSSIAGKSLSAAPDPEPLRLETIRHVERIMSQVTINGHAARFVVDTGTGWPFAVFPSTATRLHLQLMAPSEETPPEGRIALRLTAPCDIQWLGNIQKGTSLAVFPQPAFITEIGWDGVVGWPALKGNLILIQIANADAPVIPLHEFPTVPDSTQLTVADADTLILNFTPNPSDGPKLLIDTGHSGGVVLPPTRWRAWREAHPEAPVTVQTGYMPAEGYMVEEIAWADEIQIGNLVLKQVPVHKAGSTYLQHTHDGKEVVVLGLLALKRLDLVVDSRSKRALIRTENLGPFAPFAHNRIGATFLPMSGSDLKLVAHVLPLSPAAEADVRNGDTLISVNGQAAVDWWKSDSGGFRAPADTEFRLILLRGTEKIQRRVVARDILGAGLKNAAPH